MTAKDLKIAADLAASLTAAIPPRLIKKLDADPTLAERWTWTATSVTTDKGEVVELSADAGVITTLTCSCLLQPRCLHVAAVVALLEPSDAKPADVASDEADGAVAEDAPPSAIELSADAARAADRARRVLSDVLAGGAESAGAFVQAELLRAIHGCRSEGLHRLAQTQTRILRSIRELRADRAEFALEVLTGDLRDALGVAHQLAGGDRSPALVGSARREYRSAGNLQLRGVLTEAVVARSGYAGASTYLIDDRGRMYTRSDVAPGDAGRAAGAYDAAAGIGDAVLPHRELCRTGLFVSGATASADGRLGAGSKVRAVRSSEASRWDALPIASRFAMPLADQLAEIAEHAALPDELRPAGWDFGYLEGTVFAGSASVAIFAQGEVLVRLTTAHEQRVLAARDNLVVLGRASGLRVRAIGRIRIAAPRELELLAIGPAPGESRLVLAEAWHGRANVHYDRLSIPRGIDAEEVALAASSPETAALEIDLLATLRRRVERAVLGGTGTLPTHAIAELEREAAELDERALSGGALVLRDLAALAHDTTRSATGVRRAVDRDAFARAWLRAALYEDSARRRLGAVSW